MFTCIECSHNYDQYSGDPEERMCDHCLNKEDPENDIDLKRSILGSVKV